MNNILTKDQIIELADEIAVSAASFNNPQSFYNFIQARDKLKTALEELLVSQDK
jgi:hypothetical protein